jgi:hypothetical protein
MGEQEELRDLLKRLGKSVANGGREEPDSC